MLLNSLFKHWSYKLFTPGAVLREKYEALKELLAFDIACHEEMAELQELLHSGKNEDFARIRRRFTHFSTQVAGMIESLHTMAPGSYPSLKNYHKKFDFYTRFLLAPPALNIAPPFTIGFEDITLSNDNIGNKAKHLAVLRNDMGTTVPRGFVIPACAYHYLIEHNGLREEIDRALAELDVESSGSLEEISKRLTTIVVIAEIPPEVDQAIKEALNHWDHPAEKELKMAVRSSAINEDGACSFAGQYATVLEVEPKDVSKAYLTVLASKYSAEALYYRISKGMSDEETAMSVLIQQMIEPKCSGVLYTSNIKKENDDGQSLQLHVTRGLGDKLVGGAVVPDRYVINKTPPLTILAKEVIDPVISDEQIVLLADQGLKIENYFDEPQDIEWAIDFSGNCFILQARTLHTSAAKEEFTEIDNNTFPILADACEQASPGVATGPVYLLTDGRKLEEISENAILVSRDAPPDFVRVLSRISAVIAERGSRASHFATVAREFGVPFLTGVSGATDRFQQGTTVTVDAHMGRVHEGKVTSLLEKNPPQKRDNPYQRILTQAMKFITPLELIDPAGDNFTPEGCRSMHDIIRFCHEKALLSMFSAGRPGTGRGSVRLVADMPLDVFLFDVGGGISTEVTKSKGVALQDVASVPFQALWRGLSHPDVQWKQKPFDWDAYDKIELAGGVPPSKDSFAFASYAVIGKDYLHFNIRFGYHFTIVDVMCGEQSAENHCLLRFAGGGGDFEHRSLRIEFLSGVLHRLEFIVEKKGDLLEARIPGIDNDLLIDKLDMLGRLLGATKLMDMVLENDEMVNRCVEDFFNGRYSFSQEG